MTFQFRPAVRSNTIPLIGLYGQSGCGKTYSALLVARGMVGETGRIGMIDTETGRGSLYADQIPGGYEVGELDQFAPANYIEAINAFEQAGVDIIIIDSASHEWEGVGGVRDMAAAHEARSGKTGLHNWIKPKAEHAKFVQKLLRTKVPVIVCLRAKFKTKQVKIKGKTEVIKDDFTTSIQDSDFIFEMTAHMEVLPDHSIHLTKCSHPDLEKCFSNKKPLTIETGVRIAEWAKGTAIDSRRAQKKQARQGERMSTDAIYETALIEANLGTATLQAWWSGTGRSHQKHLADRLPNLKEIAEKQDTQRIGESRTAIWAIVDQAALDAFEESNGGWIDSLPQQIRDELNDLLDEAGRNIAAPDASSRIE